MQLQKHGEWSLCFLLLFYFQMNQHFFVNSHHSRLYHCQNQELLMYALWVPLQCYRCILLHETVRSNIGRQRRSPKENLLTMHTVSDAGCAVNAVFHCESYRLFIGTACRRRLSERASRRVPAAGFAFGPYCLFSTADPGECSTMSISVHPFSQFLRESVVFT